MFSIGIGYFKGFAMLSGLVGSKRSKSWKVGRGHLGEVSARR